MTPTAALLFAAGFGTRMRPLTLTHPKPLVRVAGRTLLDHTLDLCDGLQRIVVNTHYLHEKIAAEMKGRDVLLSHETPDILETGGGLRHALPLLGDPPVFTLNTDVIWRGPNPLRLLAAAWEPRVMDALLVCIPLERARGREGPGDFSIDSAGRLHRGGRFVYSGIQIINPRGIDAHETRAFSLNVLWNEMAASGRLYGLPYPGDWCDVGYPEAITLAEEMLSDV